MKAFDTDPSIRWMLVFPHPDDELALAAWLARLAQVGCPLKCVWVHSNPQREQESRNVLMRLGITRELAFLGLPDGRVHTQIEPLTEIALQVIEDFRPTRLVIPAFEQGHLDHDATNMAFSRAGRKVTVYEYPLYSSYASKFPQIGRFADATREEIFTLSEAERTLKSDLVGCYPSQSIARNLRWAEIRERLLRGDSLLKHERLRLQVPFDYRQPHVRPKEMKKVRRSSNWDVWSAVSEVAEFVFDEFLNQ